MFECIINVRRFISIQYIFNDAPCFLEVTFMFRKAILIMCFFGLLQYGFKFVVINCIFLSVEAGFKLKIYFI